MIDCLPSSPLAYRLHQAHEHLIPGVLWRRCSNQNPKSSTTLLNHLHWQYYLEGTLTQLCINRRRELKQGVVAHCEFSGIIGEWNFIHSPVNFKLIHPTYFSGSTPSVEERVIFSRSTDRYASSCQSGTSLSDLLMAQRITTNPQS